MRFMKQEQRNLWSFIVESLELTDEQNAAIEHVIPMTQELYNSILDKCNEIGSDIDPLFYSLLEEYPDFMCNYAEKIEQEVSKYDFPGLPEEEYERIRKEIYKRIREQYGEDAI